MSRASRMTRAQFEERLFGVLRWVVILFLALITIVPFYYMLLLSLKPIDALLLDPGRLWISAREFTFATYESVLKPTS
ncbi:carbohydrate ABC transporter permease, partial [Streptomyces sp. SID11233]|nr:carbohydrate ABC transporter permease [Streptomyces sp. SID11233]